MIAVSKPKPRVDFLCIGAPRSGTTWLWRVLRQHPGIWLPPVKELHYFDRSTAYPSPSHFADDRFADRLFGREARHALFRRLLIKNIAKGVLLPTHWRNLRWYLRYFCGTCGDAWYLSLFEAGKKAVRGEITPAYSILCDEDVQRVHGLLPDLRIIYIIRNPVDRTWSSFRRGRLGGKRQMPDRPADIIAALENESVQSRSDYATVIARWSAHFPAERMRICFFDEIVRQPRQLVESLFQFLGVNPSADIPPDLLNARVNASRPLDMPPAVKRCLAHRYLPVVKELVPSVGGYSEAWLREIERML